MKTNNKVVSRFPLGKGLLKRLFGKVNTGGEFAEIPDELVVVVGKADEELRESKSAVIEIGGYDGQALKETMELFNREYGKLPNEIYRMRVEDAGEYLERLIKAHKKNGVSTLAEIEEAIAERRPFVGPHARGIIEDGFFRVSVVGDIIYDERTNYFDCRFKRLAIYTEIQGMIARRIFRRDLAVIRKEHRN